MSQLLFEAVKAGDEAKVGMALKALHATCRSRRNLASVLNARIPHQGGTVLHLAASLPPRESLCVGKILLQEQDIAIDIQDHESGWTPLHKAIYYGNWAFAQELSHCSPDLSVYDREGLTPFDLLSYTLTDDLTRPTQPRSGAFKGSVETPDDEVTPKSPRYPPVSTTSRSTLYTWGSGANYNLGHADASDRIRPERVKLPQDPYLTPLSLDNPALCPIRIVLGSRHTALITAASSGNLLTCGFGRGGRLGTGGETKLTFSLVKGIHGRVVDVACGRNHTVAVTADGAVWTFGSNAHGQLGRSIAGETPLENDIGGEMQRGGRRRQSDDGGSGEGRKESLSTPGKVIGALKREIMEGATASATASAVWSRFHIYVFGLDQGHFGMDETAQNGIVLHPRRMALTLPGLDRADGVKEKRFIQQVTLTEKSMAILLTEGDIYVQAYGHLRKLIMPGSAFPREISPHILPRFRPTRIFGDSEGHVLAFLSETGEVFIWVAGASSSSEWAVRRVWSSRMRSEEAVEVGIGGSGGGSMLVCTRDGHVFTGHPRGGGVLSGELKKTRKYLWERVEALPHGVSQVSLGGSTCYAAIRQEVPVYPVAPIPHQVLGIEEDLSLRQGDIHVICHPLSGKGKEWRKGLMVGRLQSDLLFARSPTIRRAMNRHASSSHADSGAEKNLLWEGSSCKDNRKHGARIHIRLFMDTTTPTWLGAHCGGYQERCEPSASLILEVTGASSGAVYRVLCWVRTGRTARKRADRVRKEEEEEDDDDEGGETGDGDWLEDYLALLRIFGCETTQGRRPSPSQDLQPLYQSIRSTQDSITGEDDLGSTKPGSHIQEEHILKWRARKVCLVLADGEVRSGCHPTLLAHGSPFFAALCQGQGTWLTWEYQKSGEAMTTIHMKHVTGRGMDVVLRWIYYYLPPHGPVLREQKERMRRYLFGSSGWQTQEEVLDFLFHVLAISDELLMPGLTQVVQQEIILQPSLCSPTHYLVHPKSVIDIYQRACALGLEDPGGEVRRACTFYILQEMEWFYRKDRSRILRLTEDLEGAMMQTQGNHHPLTRGRMRETQKEKLALDKAHLKSIEGLQKRAEGKERAKVDSEQELSDVGGFTGEERLRGAETENSLGLPSPETSPTRSESSRNEQKLKEENAKLIGTRKSRFVPLDLSSSSVLPQVGPKPISGWSSAVPPIPSPDYHEQSGVSEAFPTLAGTVPLTSPGSSTHSTGAVSSSGPRVKISQKQRKKMQQQPTVERKTKQGGSAWNVPAVASSEVPSPGSSTPMKGKGVSISLRDIQLQEQRGQGSGRPRGASFTSGLMDKRTEVTDTPLQDAGRRRGSNSRRQVAPPPSSWQTPLAAPTLGSSPMASSSRAASSRAKEKGKGKERSFNAIQQEQDQERSELERAQMSSKSLVDIQTEELVIQGWRDYYAALGVENWQPPPDWKMG
ncbi:hypothetical protein BJ684DRAFT_18394 [Piptocephalis cylindrospora]|uniref:Uncharacterized protein n=1 Tax=Piptocephalis cylindrospora TaxID=1907219 RepID=A0A4P9Y8B6_9FUNG|nr:hypothetical protein BJ684DRAFT_18394 [Piptocephalis cylindrospora]|eukprot:RKP15275.1 hypothetical protein BJ684DRAFT_18394 [Piptocephalis cylindrospora]